MSPRISAGLLLEAAAEPRGQVVDAVGEPEHLDEVVGVLLPLLGLVQAGDVLDVLAEAEVVVEHRVVGQVRQRGAGLDACRRGGPAMNAHPFVGSSMPDARPRKVDFPAPLGPTSMTSSPGPILRSSSETRPMPSP